MIGSLKTLFCIHEYEMIDKVRHFEPNEGCEENTLGFTYILQCTKCGKLDKKRFNAQEIR